MKTFSISFIICMVLSPGLTLAQRDFVQKDFNKDGSLTYVEFRTDSVPKLLSNAKQVLKETLKMQQDDSFILSESKTDELGFTHHYYQQFYKGVRVAYSSYSVHGKNNTINTINGNFNKISNVITTPTLTEKTALASAMKFINASVYKWEVPAEEKWIKDNFNESYFPKGELVIVKDRLKTNENFRLAWKFDIYAHAPLSRDYVYVDAISGEIIDTDSRIHHINANGTADTRYSGARNIITDTFTGGFRLRETRNNVRVETYNMRTQGPNYGSATDFTDNNNAWTNAEFNNANRDNAALDAHWGAEMVYDYWNTVHNRNSWNGAGGNLLSYVHADLVSMGFQDNDNAFWDGSKMTYGDGTTCFRPVTSLDVCAHEIGHGINSSTARMKYEGESGAINEALSDIWAACIEVWAAPASANDPDKNQWLIGEEISLCGNALRSMGNPNSLGQPDTYLSPTAFWFNTAGCTPNNGNDHCGVHTNSGVINFWFFLLSQGGAGTNDLNNAFNVNGIGINSAARIVYNAESIQLASANEQIVTFNQFRTASITAVRNLFGSNSCEEIAVTNAWFAVGVGTAFTSTLIIGGAEPICTTKTFALPNQPVGTTLIWSSSNTSRLTVNATSGLATRVNNYNGSVNLNATLTGQGGCSSIVTRTVQVGAFNTSQITVTGTLGVCPSNWYTYTANFPGGHRPGYTYQWTKPANWGLQNQWDNFITLSIPTYNQPDYGTVRVSIFNTCGTTAHTGITVYPGYGCYSGYSFSVSPNPATDLLTVALIENENAESTNASTSIEGKSGIEEYTVELSTDSGQKIISQISINGTVNINTQSLRKGLYILKIFSSEEVITKRILIN